MKKTAKPVLFGVAALLVGAALMVFHWLGDAGRAALGRLTEAIGGVLGTEALSTVITGAYPVLAFCLLAALLCLALKRWWVAALSATAWGFLCLIPAFSLPECLLHTAGVLLGVAAVMLFRLAWRRFPKVFNRETVSYVVFGVLTTVVNIVVYLAANALLPIGNAVTRVAVANVIAWIASVAFAYVVNKLFVFRSRTRGAKELLWEAGKFVGARLFSFAVDEAGMILLEGVLKMPSFWAKVIVNVAVLIMNYFFSKLFIFKGHASAKAPADPPAGTPDSLDIDPDPLE